MPTATIKKPIDEPLVTFEEQDERDDCSAGQEPGGGQGQLHDECHIFGSVGEVVAGVWTGVKAGITATC